MRPTTDIFTVNGHPLPAPDADVTVSRTDVEVHPPVWDQDGVLHRSVIRTVTDWTFCYTNLTEEERQLLEGLFPTDGGVFDFVHPDPGDLKTLTCSSCCREDYRLTLRDVRGLWSSCSFRIREV